MTAVIYIELEAHPSGRLALVQVDKVSLIESGAKEEGGKGRRSYSVLTVIGREQPLWVRGDPRHVGNLLEKAYMASPGVHREQVQESH